MPITAALHMEHSDMVMAFAGDELRQFLAQGFGVEFAEQAGWQFILKHDTSLPEFAFAVQSDGQQVTLTGHDSTGVLHAVYTLLEHLGYRFEITGPRLAATDDDETLADLLAGRLQNLAMRVEPKVRWRGIRQHLNFPMDISSYPLPEALDYIRNMARMRLNHVTFHSYPDQWYAVNFPDGRKTLAGGYFYGQRYDIPEHPVLNKVLRNESTFCIPEHEPYMDDAEENSRRAISWLKSVMNEAKRVGLRIQFSFELREQNLADSLATVDAILHTYPRIDVLEVITQESGEWGYAAPADDLKKIAVEYFGEDVLNDEAITRHLVDGQKDLDRLMREIGHAIQVFSALKLRGKMPPRMVVGVYCTVRSDHAGILALLQKYVPDGVTFALLLNHGNRAVAQNLRDLNMPRADWERSLIYSWIEFDGTMYLFQNAIEGIYRLITLAEEVYEGDAVNAISFNHWRTAENQTSTRYAAESMLNGALNPQTFYQAYGASHGLTGTRIERYAQAMALVDDADTAARDKLPNVGFCYAGCWGVQGLGYYGVFKPEKLQEVRAMYETALTDLQLAHRDLSFAAGRAYLAFIINRIQCTMVFLQAIETAVQLQPIAQDKTPGQLNPAEQKQVRAICDRALALMEDMMALHAQQIAGRGCEGTLISFYHTPPAVLKRIRAEYGGEGSFSTAVATDAPPSPIWSEE